MNINRHNYETFFLLYVDKELSAAEVKAVDVFVEANPDLKEELQMLQQTVLMPGEINIDFRSSLLKEEKDTVLQKNLLLFIDDELNVADKNKLQVQLQKDTAATAVLDILLQTKLTPDSHIVFENKQSLYRREPAGVIGIRWWRIAAAAVIFGFGIWGAANIYNKQAVTRDDGSTASAQGNPVKKETTTTPAKDTNSSTINPVNTIQQNTGAQNIAVLKAPVQNAVSPVIKQNTAQQLRSAKDKLQQEGKENVATANSVKKETNNLPTPLENINNLQRNKNNSSFVLPTESNNARDPQKDIALVKGGPTDKLKGVTLTEPVNPDAKNAVYKEDDNVIAMQDQQVKHSKLGGFLRKVRRVIERTTKIKTGDDDVIKVAGFDIAIK